MGWPDFPAITVRNLEEIEDKSTGFFKKKLRAQIASAVDKYEPDINLIKSCKEKSASKKFHEILEKN